MLETPHVVVGAAIAMKVVNPVLSIPLAFVSHFILDTVPHWNPHINTEKKKFGKVTKKSFYIIVADSVLAFFFGSFIAYRALPNLNLFLTVMLSSLAAVLPDIIEAPYYFLNKKYQILDKWITFQKSIQVNSTPYIGFLTQFLTLLAAFWWMSK